MNFSLRCHLCQTRLPRRRAVGLRRSAWARSRSRSTTTRSRRRSRARPSSAGPKNLWRYRELLPIDGEPRTGLHSGFTPLVRADRLAEAAGRPRAVREGRLGQPSDLLVQGSRRLGRRHARGRAGLHGVRVRVDRQPRRQRRVARRAARPRRARSSFPTISRPARSPAPASIARASSPSAATTTT